MANNVVGNILANANLTTNFGSGTAGSATEINNLGSQFIAIGPDQAAGRQVTDDWSITYTNMSSPQTLDLTALPGIGGRTIDLTTPNLRIIQAINSDPTAGHDVAISPGASNGLDSPWTGTTPADVIPGGMPGAGIVDGKPFGTPFMRCNFSPTGWPVDATHKTILLTPTGTVTSFTLLLAG